MSILLRAFDKTHFISASSQPTDGRVQVGTLWSKTSTNELYICTAITPAIAFALVTGGGGGGTGDVVGPAGATDNAIARFDLATGKLIQDSGITIADGATGALSGTNSGDVALAGENYLSIAGQTITAGAVNLSGTNATGTLAAARMPALTGDVTTSAGAVATSIGANKVTDAMLRQSAGVSIVGRSANTTGNVADITAAANGQVLKRSANALGFAAVDLTADVSGDLPLANLAQGSALSVLGVTGNATADNASIAAGSDKQVLRRSGTALGFGAIDLASSAAVSGLLPQANLAVPVCQNLAILGGAAGFNPVDGTTYRIGLQPGINPSTSEAYGYILGRAGTVKAATLIMVVAGTLGSGETFTIRVRNGTAGTTSNITTTATASSVVNSFSNASMSLAFNANEVLDIEVVAPTWATNPTTVTFTGFIYVEYS